MSSTIDTLRRMANDIARNLASMGHEKAVLATADHIESFWDPLCRLFDHMLDEAFIRPGLMLRYMTVERVEDVIPKLHEAVAALPPSVESEAETAEKM